MTAAVVLPPRYTALAGMPRAELEYGMARERLVPFTIRMYGPQYRPGRHHHLIAETLEAVERGDVRRVIIQVPPRHGKALALDTPIPTPTGWTTMGEIRPGDRVFGADGRPCTVVAVSPVWRDRPVYRVVSDTGDEIVADAAHEWVVSNEGRRDVFLVRDTEFLARPRVKRPMIRRAAPLDLPTAKLPFPPYTLGLWLGDGHTAQAVITAGEQDAAWVMRRVAEDGVEVRERPGYRTYGLRGGAITRLRDLGVIGAKHIPTAYLRASEDQRRDLLRGLIDSDGYVAPDGQVEFCSTNDRLARDVAELVVSLGCKASVIEGRATLAGRDCGPKYRVMFYMAGAASIPRKEERCRDGTRQPNHYVHAIPAGTADTVCIEVDAPDHLFLAGRSMIPTHNSTIASEHFPAWYLGRNPDKRIIACSYAANLAYRFSRRARNMLVDPRWPFPEVQARRDSRTVSAWDIAGHKGGYVAAGVGGSITGIGANCLVIDDAVKNQQEADSPVFRERVWEWYQSTALTRVEPGGAVFLIMTRWHEDDLVGRALADDPSGWEVIDLPAIADGGPDALDRPAGQALWPEVWDEDALAERRRAVGERAWTALYQQRPSPAGGAVFKRDWWRRYDTVPRIADAAIFVDSAFKDGVASDYSAFALWGRTDDDGYYLLDLWRERVQFPELVQAGHDFHARARALLPDLRAVPLVVEDKASGQSAIQVWSRPYVTKDGARLPKLPVIPWKVGSTSKVSRAEAVSPLVESGLVHLPASAPWVGAFVEEHAAFPTGVHDDMVDTTSMGLARLSQRRQSGVRSF